MKINYWKICTGLLLGIIGVYLIFEDNLIGISLVFISGAIVHSSDRDRQEQSKLELKEL